MSEILSFTICWSGYKLSSFDNRQLIASYGFQCLFFFFQTYAVIYYTKEDRIKAADGVWGDLKGLFHQLHVASCLIPELQRNQDSDILLGFGKTFCFSDFYLFDLEGLQYAAQSHLCFLLSYLLYCPLVIWNEKIFSSLRSEKFLVNFHYKIESQYFPFSYLFLRGTCPKNFFFPSSHSMDLSISVIVVALSRRID